MPEQLPAQAAGMLTELIFRFYSACQRHPKATGPKIHSHGFHILYLLARAQNKRLSTSFLLTEQQMTKQQLSKIIGELEELGFVERERADNDRRNVFVRLTEAGEGYFLESAGAVSHGLAQALEKQPPEKIETVYRLLSTLLEKE